jgi:GNAT superfamily N-acetyltransferase
MARVRIRTFAERDRAALRKVFVAARDAAFVWAPPGSHRPKDFDATISGEIVLVAVADRAPIGFASIWQPDSFLHNLFVHPGFQGRGVGSALLAACAPYFHATATLKCLKRNRAARRWRARLVRPRRGEGPGGYISSRRDGFG